MFRPVGARLRTILGSERFVTSAALSVDGRTLATCSASLSHSFDDQKVRIWDARTGVQKRELANTQMQGRFVLFSPDGTIRATNGVGKSIAIWDLRIGEWLRNLVGHGHPPQSAAFSADGRLLVSRR